MKIRKMLFLFLLSCFLVTSAPQAEAARDVKKSAALDARFLQAFYDGSIARMKTLLAQGANVDARDKDGDTALLKTMLPPYGDGGNISIARFLLAHGAAVDGRDAQGSTPLMLASEAWDDIVKLLCAHGANVNAKNFKGQTPLMFAANGVFTEIGTDLSSPSIVRFLLQRGAAVNAADKTGETALIAAAKTDCGPQEGEQAATETVRILLARGANPKARTHNGNTALKWALLRNHRDMAQMLRRAGAKN